jgi:hypothetical protein
MTAPVKMSDLKSKLLRPSLTSTYLVEVQAPTGINTKLSAFSATASPTTVYDYINLACSEASLPGSSVLTNEITDDFTGVTERYAYRRAYDDRSDFTFYVDAKNYYVIKYFESWIAVAVNEQYSTIQNRNSTYRVAFPDDYVTGGPNGGALSITKFEKDSGSIFEDKGTPLKYNFVGAYPISINSMPVSYDSSQLLKCTVSFTYLRYYIGNAKAAASASSEPSGQQPAPGNPNPNTPAPTPTSPTQSPTPTAPISLPVIPFRDQPLF